MLMHYLIKSPHKDSCVWEQLGGQKREGREEEESLNKSDRDKKAVRGEKREEDEKRGERQ